MRLTEYWRLKENRYQLNGGNNTNDETVTFPPRPARARQAQRYHFENDNINERKRTSERTAVAAAS